MSNKFDEDYFERGEEKGISGYTNYHYIPTRSISEATSIIDAIEFNSALDFGCARGFLVHALNLLGKKAYGVDISEYAVNNCIPQVKDAVSLINERINSLDGIYDLIIAKDVLEHLDEEYIKVILKVFHQSCETLFIVVPLADNGVFRIAEYDRDITHVTRRDEEWWINNLKEAGFEIESFSYEFGEIKTKWKSNKFGNGFIVAVPVFDN